MFRKPSSVEGLDLSCLLDDEVSLYYDSLDNYDPSTDRCQACNGTGLVMSSSYKRWIYALENGVKTAKHIYVRCVHCEGCGGYYHALLFDILVPFTRYTLHFIMAVLDAYFHRTTAVVDLCLEWGISKSTLYRWRRRFISHYNLWTDDSVKKIPEEDHKETSDTASRPGYHWKLRRIINAKAREAFEGLAATPSFATAFFDRVRLFSFMQPNDATHLKKLPKKCRAHRT